MTVPARQPCPAHAGRQCHLPNRASALHLVRAHNLPGDPWGAGAAPDDDPPGRIDRRHGVSRLDVSVMGAPRSKQMTKGVRPAPGYLAEDDCRLADFIDT